MTTFDSSLKYNPFGELKNCIGRRSLPKPASVFASKSKPEPAGDPEIEGKVFLEAVLDVKPIQRDKCAGNKIRIKPPDDVKESPEAAIVGQLTNLVKYGEGFVISDTPEYIEGTGYDVHPEFAGRLHRGDFSIQAHVDLHGQSVAEAKKTFEEFLKGAVKSGRRAVLIVHGRGLSSPGEPVLKNNVREWLTRGHWRKWVIAFSSAQSYDGGAGATYILLRHRPISKRSRRQGPAAPSVRK
ncbi:MAG: Smr/MutS family protein [Syntrophales bacterium]